MELSWLMRLRITAAMGTGVILIGILGFSVAGPADPFGAVSLAAGSISTGGSICLVMLAFLSGFIAYFLSWPYGKEIGILAAPSGLAILALRTGSMATLMQLNPTFAQRQALFATLKWEPVFWLAIVAAGFAGVLFANRLSPIAYRYLPFAICDLRFATSDKPSIQYPVADAPKLWRRSVSSIIGLVGSVLIAQLLIGLFAQDVKIFDPKLGSVAAQPAVGQIAFAVIVSFGLVAFATKTFLNVSYIWPTIGSALVTAFSITTYVKQDVLQHLVWRQPAAFFSSAVISILPVQMVSFGTLGAIAGYWLAVRYNSRRKTRKIAK